MTIKIRVQKTYKEMQKTSLLLRMSYVKENGPFHSEPSAESLWQGNIWCKYTLIYEDYNIFLLCCKENRINKFNFFQQMQSTGTMLFQKRACIYRKMVL